MGERARDDLTLGDPSVRRPFYFGIPTSVF